MAPVPALDTAPAVAGQPTPVRLRALLVGNPNTGKTTLFNLLCGARAKTSNFPGTTTALRTGSLRRGHLFVDVLDMPGIYDEMLDTPEARIVRNAMSDARRNDDLVMVIVDASNLGRHLVLVGQLLAAHSRLIVCLNMLDVARRRGLAVDTEALAARLGVPVVPMVASRGEGVETLRWAIDTQGVQPAGAMARAAGVPPPDAPHSAVTAWARDVAAAVTRQ